MRIRHVLVPPRYEECSGREKREERGGWREEGGEEREEKGGWRQREEVKEEVRGEVRKVAKKRK